MTAVAITYLQFHAVFVVPVVAVLAAATARRERAAWDRTLAVGLPVLVAVALAYTAPWDNYLIARGVWHYGDGAVAATLWLAPVEEYLFVAVQPVLTGLWLSQLSPSTPDTGVTRRQRAAGAAAGFVVAAAGLALVQRADTLYLGAILAWAGPVLALQWAFGWPVLWATRRTVALGVAVPALYLSVADRIALSMGVWTLSERYTTGLAIAGLPVEEALFFVVTNLFVVQGLVLLRWLVTHPDRALEV